MYTAYLAAASINTDDEELRSLVGGFFSRRLYHWVSDGASVWRDVKPTHAYARRDPDIFTSILAK
jgi:hypothetical protein